MLISQEDFLNAAGLNRRGLRWLGPPLIRLLHIREINRIYAEHQDKEGIEFIDAALADLGVDYHLPTPQWDFIPSDRPFILTANHPLGIIDGLLLMRIVAEKRSDFKIMGNFLLERVSSIRHWVIRVNPIRALRNARGNLGGMRETVQQLSAGRPLLVFPAGTVSTFHIRTGKTEDRPWRAAIGKWIQNYECEIIPLYIHGRNGFAFQLLARIHPVLKLALQVPVAFQQAGKTIEIRIGKPIPASELRAKGSPGNMMQYLRTATYQLREESLH